MRVKMLRLIGIVIVLITFLGCSSKHKIIGTEFKNGDITFSANIYKPKGNGPFPAVIMVHGSKNHTKDYYTEYSKYFADNGIVTMITEATENQKVIYGLQRSVTLRLTLTQQLHIYKRLIMSIETRLDFGLIVMEVG